MKKRILLTGAAGRLGTILRPQLVDNWLLRSVDVRPIINQLEGEEIICFDLADGKNHEQIVQDCWAIVHFGGIPLEASFDQINRTNIAGTFHLYEAARAAGVKRILFASSHHVTGHIRIDECYNTEQPVRADSLYGLSKVYGEALGQLYYDRYGIEHASLRIGMCTPEPFDHRSLAIWLSHTDLIRLVKCCLQADTLGSATLFGVSRNTRGRLDNSKVTDVGYQPECDSEDFAQRILASTPPLDPKDVNQINTGGYFTSNNPPQWGGLDSDFVPSQFKAGR